MPRPEILYGLVLLSVFAFWMLSKIRFFRKIDSDGLTIGAFKLHFIPWEKVAHAATQKSLLRIPYLEIRAEGRIFSVEYDPICIAAVRQHLRRRGAAGKIAIPKEALSLWRPIPGDLPDEIEWCKKSYYYKAIIYLLFAAASSIFIGYVVLMDLIQLNLFTPFLVIAGIGFLFLMRYQALPEILFCAHFAKADRECLQAKVTFGDVIFRWEEITDANWRRRDLLIVRARVSGKEAHIPFRVRDEKSEELILTIIRHLRNRREPLAILLPDELLASENTAAGNA